jgi:hypothetical protein
VDNGSCRRDCTKPIQAVIGGIASANPLYSSVPHTVWGQGYWYPFTGKAKGFHTLSWLIKGYFMLMLILWLEIVDEILDDIFL